MKKLISVDIRAPLGFLKKPDINNKDSMYLTYNFLHKPALMGIMGAIVGLAGYAKKDLFPEYYTAFRDVAVGIQPLNLKAHGNFIKSVVQYNNGVGYASQEEGGNLIIREQMLIQPQFRCYIEVDSDEPIQTMLSEYLKKQEAVFLPYFGKNEYSLWWDNYREYAYKTFEFDRDFQINTIFTKTELVIKELKHKKVVSFLSMEDEQACFIQFEDLPDGFHEVLYQYTKQSFVFSNFTFTPELRLKDLYQLEGDDGLVQLI